MRIRDRGLVFSAYLFGFPALYIVLTEKKNNGFVRRNGEKALFAWVLLFLTFFSFRYLIELL